MNWRPVFRVLLALIFALPLTRAATKDLVETLMDTGHWKRARTLVEKPAQDNPNDARLAYLLSRLRQSFGDLEAAHELAKKAVALDSNNSAYHLRLAEVVGQIAEHAGLFKQIGYAKTYRKECETAVSLDAKNLDARFDLIEYYLQAPGIAGGDKKKAAAMAEEILRINALRGYLAQARIAQDAKDVSRQESYYLKAVAQGPRNYDAHASLANFYASDSVKKYDLAEKYARESLNIDPEHVAAYALLAAIFARQQRWKDLDAILAQAETKVPDDWNPYYQAGRALLLDGSDLPRAERYFRKYLTQEPEGHEPGLGAAHWRLGLVLEKQGRKPEARGEVENAVRLDANLAEAKKDLQRLK